MLKRMTCIIALSSLTAACVTKEAVTPAPTPVDAAALQASLAKQKESILSSINSGTASQQASLNELNSQLALLQGQVEALKVAATAQSKKPVAQVSQPKDLKKIDASPLGDKFILGAVERVYVDEVKASFNTRIDTGAESSSLDSRNIVLFERDGNSWVRFDVFVDGPNKPAKTFEAKVARFVRIKQDADDGSDRRPVILAHLKIGQYEAQTELNLVNRSHLDYPLLLGRKFMQDIAVVDVGRTFIHGKKGPNTMNYNK
ncbi:ATP-dependent zinc protease family protein [Shewanella surugensis]|uniref:RimK/LysX family protein n=1 Tax=Shewanella surugensis TaxID=212020 RepID=A0ABT0LB14_9GAMM|nr:RimK/LysX family protein [Shewanella surugensis]MCL1124764.1 RimK/LysX family protein [Shewanella surugensis]